MCGGCARGRRATHLELHQEVAALRALAVVPAVPAEQGHQEPVVEEHVRKVAVGHVGLAAQTYYVVHSEGEAVPEHADHREREAQPQHHERNHRDHRRLQRRPRDRDLHSGLDDDEADEEDQLEVALKKSDEPRGAPPQHERDKEDDDAGQGHADADQKRLARADVADDLHHHVQRGNDAADPHQVRQGADPLLVEERAELRLERRVVDEDVGEAVHPVVLREELLLVRRLFGAQIGFGVELRRQRVEQQPTAALGAATKWGSIHGYYHCLLFPLILIEMEAFCCAHP